MQEVIMQLREVRMGSTPYLIDARFAGIYSIDVGDGKLEGCEVTLHMIAPVGSEVIPPHGDHVKIMIERLTPK